MTKNQFTKIKGLFMWLSLCIGSFSAMAQSGSFGNTFIYGGGEAIVHNGMHNFVNGGLGIQPGIVGTERNSTSGFLGFVNGATWNGASANAYVDGYVKTYLTGSFIFPIGDNAIYQPAAVSASSSSNPTSAAYFAADPSVAITSSLKGGNESALPSGAPFNRTSKSLFIKKVDSLEYWDINGTTPAKITLTWNASSSVSNLTAGILNNLIIVGWNGTQWVEVPGSIDVTSILGGASSLSSGSITTTSNVTPDTYTVYTLASKCTPPTGTTIIMCK